MCWVEHRGYRDDFCHCPQGACGLTFTIEDDIKYLLCHKNGKSRYIKTAGGRVIDNVS